MRKIKTYEITVTAVMAAFASVIYLLFPEIPLVVGIDYLKMDFSDIPAIATGIALNPLCGVLVEVLKNVIHLLRTTTFGIGEIINILMGASIIISLNAFSNLLKNKTKLNAFLSYIISCVITVIITVIIGWFVNAVFTPIYFLLAGLPIKKDIVIAGIIGSTLLNAVKAALNIFPFYPLYFALKRYFIKIKH